MTINGGAGIVSEIFSAKCRSRSWTELHGAWKPDAQTCAAPSKMEYVYKYSEYGAMTKHG